LQGKSGIAVSVVEDTHCFDGDDGTRWWSNGYAPVHVDDDGGYHFAALGEHLGDGRVLYCKVAGARHYDQGIADPRLRPGITLELRPEPNNPYDSDAVGVWEAKGALQLGHIPADVCSDVSARIRAGERLDGYVVREIRRESKSGPRTALHLLVAPAGEIKLVVVKDS
jgi:hypothetical protein